MTHFAPPSALPQPFFLHLWAEPRSLQGKALRFFVIALVASFALAASAKISLPFYPVPMTMQTYIVLMIGLTLGAPLAAASVLLYLLEGLLGLPVFATGAGLAYLLGPTGGYLAGFVLAALLLGYLVRHNGNPSLRRTVLGVVAAETVIFLLGWAWLSTFIGGTAALYAGILPFVPAEIFKVALVSLTLPALWKVTRKA